jgi:hypothetical protein
MVIALLVCLAATVATGLIAYGEQGKGPVAAALAAGANANGDEAGHHAQVAAGGERTESVMGGWHDLLANITLALVVAHISGVAVASIVHRENLVAADDHRKETPAARLSGDGVISSDAQLGLPSVFSAATVCRNRCAAGSRRQIAPSLTQINSSAFASTETCLTAADWDAGPRENRVDQIGRASSA